MKAKKNRFGIALSVTVVLFFLGVAKLLTITDVPPDEAASSGSSIGQKEASSSGSSASCTEKASSGRKEAAAKSGGSAGPEEKLLPDGSAGQDGTSMPDSSAGPAQNGPVEKKKVALTFDDGPDSEYTPMLLDGLAERNVKATFFVIGKQAEQQPEVMERMVKEGHLIGNHTYNHVDIRHMTESAAKEEIKKANEVIEKYTGEEPCFLRPPFGSGSSKLERQIEMISVLWTIDTMDWACQNESKICTTVYREIEENSIILMHDEYPTSVRAALSIVDKLLEDGYEFVTVDQIVMD